MSNDLFREPVLLVRQQALLPQVRSFLGLDELSASLEEHGSELQGQQLLWVQEASPPNQPPRVLQVLLPVHPARLNLSSVSTRVMMGIW